MTKVSKRRTVGRACEKVSESQEQNHGHFYVNEDDNVRAYPTETCSWLAFWILLHGKNVLAYFNLHGSTMFYFKIYI